MFRKGGGQCRAGKVQGWDRAGGGWLKVYTKPFSWLKGIVTLVSRREASLPITIFFNRFKLF